MDWLVAWLGFCLPGGLVGSLVGLLFLTGSLVGWLVACLQYNLTPE